jgi:hypothetical protein
MDDQVWFGCLDGGKELLSERDVYLGQINANQVVTFAQGICQRLPELTVRAGDIDGVTVPYSVLRRHVLSLLSGQEIPYRSFRIAGRIILNRLRLSLAGNGR